MVEQINTVHKRLETFDSLNADNISGELKISEESNPTLSRTKSFKTNFSSSIELWNKFGEKGIEKVVGFVIKGTIDEVYKKVFLKLKEMNIIWKKYFSNYVYKCQTGIPITTKPNLDGRKEKIKEQYAQDMIKFFLQFSSLPRKMDLSDLDQTIKQQHQFLVSFIWIKGPTMKYLDFISNLNLTI